jgi:hypothetical protein
MRIIFWSVVIAVLTFGCKPKQNVASSKSPASAPAATSDEIEAKNQAYNNVVISFYSKGEGVNAKAVETIENFLKEYPSKVHHAIPYNKISWGREGEIDFCISLAEFKGDDKRIFVDKIRELVKQFELINFFENHPCKELK